MNLKISSEARHDADVIIIGASMAGLLAAAAASHAGKTVLIVDRDVLDGSLAPRKGVSQGHQPHVLLYRGLRAIEELLPGFRRDLIEAGGVPLDTGDLAWLGEQGWAPIGNPAFELVSATRPVVEQLVRQRVTGLPGIVLRDGLRIAGLERGAARSPWTVRQADGSALSASLVIDASGRASRLPIWLAEGGFGEVKTTSIDAGFGYASRVYEAPARHLAPAAGIILLPTPSSPVGGVALPVEGGRWMVGAVGAGDHCPPREAERFMPFLEGLRDPALADFARSATAISDVVIHRRTDNVRHHYDRMPAWPAGLLAVGDSFCAFNPVYGQGITVSACQALLLRHTLKGDLAFGAERQLMRRLGGLADLPWEIATGEDLRYSTSGGQSTPIQALFGKWSRQLDLLAAHGDVRAQRALDRVYHLVGSPRELLHPLLLLSAFKARLFGLPQKLPRPLPAPAVLATKSGTSSSCPNGLLGNARLEGLT